MTCRNCEEQLEEDDEEPDCDTCPLPELAGRLTAEDWETLGLYGRLASQLVYDFGLAPAVFQLAGPKSREGWKRTIDRLIRIHAELHPSKDDHGRDADD